MPTHIEFDQRTAIGYARERRAEKQRERSHARFSGAAPPALIGAPLVHDFHDGLTINFAGDYAGA